VRPQVHALGLAAAALGLLAAAAALPLDAPPLSLFACPVKAATGLPCLTCGCTHAFHHFVRGEFAQAFLASPLGLLLAAACAAHVAITALRLLGLEWSPAAPRVSPRLARWAVGVALAANWAFLALRGAA
jgi:hypothetical protein